MLASSRGNIFFFLTPASSNAFTCHSSRLIGTWSGTTKRGEIAVSGKTVFSADGAFRSSVLIRADTSLPHLVLVSGIWKVERGSLVQHVQNSSDETLVSPDILIVDYIVSLNPNIVVLRAQSNGRKIILYRE